MAAPLFGGAAFKERHMKKTILLAIITLAAVLVFAAEVTVTTTPQRITAPSGGPYWIISIINTGSETIYFRKNITTNAFSISSAIPIPPGYSYTTPIPGSGKIPSSQAGSCVVATTNGTSSAAIAFGGN